MTALQAGSIGRGWWQSLPSHRSALSKAACRDSGLMNVGRLDGDLDRILLRGILNYGIDAPGWRLVLDERRAVVCESPLIVW